MAVLTEAWLHEYPWSIQYMWYDSVVQRTLATSHFECTQESTYLFARFFLVTCDVKWHLPVIYPLNLPKPQRLYGSFEFHSRGMQGKSYKCRSRLTREEHICRHNSVLKFSSKCADFMIFVFGNIFGCMQWMPNSQVALPKLKSEHHFVSFRVISIHFNPFWPKFWIQMFLLQTFSLGPGKFARTKFRLHPIWWGLRLRCFAAWNILPYHRHGWVWLF